VLVSRCERREPCVLKVSQLFSTQGPKYRPSSPSKTQTSIWTFCSLRSSSGSDSSPNSLWRAVIVDNGDTRLCCVLVSRCEQHNMSNIDAHFAPGYDPATDVHLDEDKLHSIGQESPNSLWRAVIVDNGDTRLCCVLVSRCERREPCGRGTYSLARARCL
jgi:hypothetical protein